MTKRPSGSKHREPAVNRGHYMSKRSTTDAHKARSHAGRRGRRAGSKRAKVKEGARIVVRLHKHALKELEKY